MKEGSNVSLSSDVVSLVQATAALLQDVGFCEGNTVNFVSQSTGGTSNLTLILETDKGRVVSRTGPAADVADSSHDVMREYRFLSALQSTEVPVPEPVSYDADQKYFDRPFYVMKFVPGVSPQEANAFERKSFVESRNKKVLLENAITVLGQLHLIRWESLGFKPRNRGYLESQIWRLERRLGSMSTAHRLTGMEAIIEWLKSNMPTGIPDRIVHGDYGLHNMLIRPGSPPRVCAVVDWELATIGNPVCDLVWFERQITENGSSGNPAGYVYEGAGVPTSDEIIRKYERVTELVVEDLEFYRIFSAWKGIVMWEGLFDLYQQGKSTRGEFVASFEQVVPKRVRALRERIEQG